MLHTFRIDISWLKYQGQSICSLIPSNLPPGNPLPGLSPPAPLDPVAAPGGSLVQGVLWGVPPALMCLPDRGEHALAHHPCSPGRSELALLCAPKSQGSDQAAGITNP